MSSSLRLLLALACAASASASSAAAGAKYVLLVFTEACYARFLSGDFLHWGCLRLTASRAIGVAIITGACVVKLPQIAAFVAAGSAAGCSLGAAYAELAGYALTLIFHVTNGSPWTAYGEAVVVAAQAAAVVGIMWAYAWPGVTHAALAAAAGAAPRTSPPCRPAPRCSSWARAWCKSSTTRAPAPRARRRCSRSS